MFGVIPFGTNEDVPRRHFPYVTAAIVAINVAVFAYMLVLLNSQGLDTLNAFIQHYATIPTRVLSRGWIDPTLLTSTFLHGGFLHLASNMLYLMAFGDNVEDRLGPWRYLLLYLAWGVIGSATHVLFNTGSDLPSLGASGAIAGVLGAYLVLFPRGVVKTFVFFFFFFTITRLPAMLIIGGWFLLQLFSGIGSLGVHTAQTSGVAVWAHIGGFIAGFISARFFVRHPEDESK